MSACVAVSLVTLAAGGSQNGGTITRTLRFAGSGERMLDVRTINGSIRVTGYDGSDVHMDVRKTIDADRDEDRQAAEKEVSLEFEDGSSRVAAIVREPSSQICGEPNEGTRWRYRGYSVKFDFTIQVPRNTRLRLCTINGGSLRVDGTNGDFRVDNVNGRVVMTGIRGSGSAHTVNGPVDVTFLESPRTASSFKTVNGNIEVTFPSSLSADLKLKTFHGGLLTDFDYQPLPPEAPDPGTRRDGRYVYRSNDFTRVRVGRGGPEIAFETLNGDVRVLRAAR